MPAGQIVEIALEVLTGKLKTLTDMLIKTPQAAASLGNIVGGPSMQGLGDGSGGLLDLM